MRWAPLALACLAAGCFEDPGGSDNGSGDSTTSAATTGSTSAVVTTSTTEVDATTQSADESTGCVPGAELGCACEDGRCDAPLQCVADLCIPASCGDGEPQPPEECDDGNNAPNDGCSPLCQLENRCFVGAIGGVPVQVVSVRIAPDGTLDLIEKSTIGANWVPLLPATLDAQRTAIAGGYVVQVSDAAEEAVTVALEPDGTFGGAGATTSIDRTASIVGLGSTGALLAVGQDSGDLVVGIHGVAGDGSLEEIGSLAFPYGEEIGGIRIALDGLSTEIAVLVNPMAAAAIVSYFIVEIDGTDGLIEIDSGEVEGFLGVRAAAYHVTTGDLVMSGLNPGIGPDRCLGVAPRTGSALDFSSGGLINECDESFNNTGALLQVGEDVFALGRVGNAPDEQLLTELQKAGTTLTLGDTTDTSISHHQLYRAFDDIPGRGGKQRRAHLPNRRDGPHVRGRRGAGDRPGRRRGVPVGSDRTLRRRAVITAEGSRAPENQIESSVADDTGAGLGSRSSTRLRRPSPVRTNSPRGAPSESPGS